MNFNKNLIAKAQKILEIIEKRNLKIASAESCTGGLLAGLFTEIAGSSKTFERGFVVYSNCAKNEMLGVKNNSLKKYGAVSQEVAKEMAIGAIKNSVADIAISITGIAGPSGGSKNKPVGLVYIAVASCGANKVMVRKFNFCGNRSDVRKSTLISALEMLEISTQTHL